MENENLYDLHIGETQRIPWVEFDVPALDVFEVDYILSKYRVFWNFLEIDCVAACCGLGAFRFYPEDISKAANHIDRNQLKRDLDQLRQDVIKSGKQIVSSSILNNSIHHTVFIQLLDHIIAHCSSLNSGGDGERKV